MALSDKATREPLPVDRSIQWLPLGDSQHVVASLRPGAHPVRIVIAQPVLRRLDTIARSTASEREIGLLLGDVRACPVANTLYMIITALAEYRPASANAAPLEHTLARIIESSRRKSGRLLGWYHRGDGPPYRMASDEEGAHRAHFPEPWHPALILRSGSRGVAGTFLQHDMTGAATFAAPFYELIDPKFLRAHAAKPTCIAWHNYIAAEEVTQLPRVDESEAPRPTPVGGEPRKPRWTLWRGLGDRDAVAEKAPRPAPAPRAVQDRRSDDGPPPVPHTPRAPHPAREAPLGTAAAYPPATSLQPTTPATSAGTTAAAPPPAPMSAEHGGHTRTAPARRPAAEFADSSAGDSPSQFIEVARSDGFFVVAKFDADPGTHHREALWVLHDPYCGLLLLLVASGSTILDASLHYNLRADDPATFEAVFSEYRDAESRIVYMRESCLDGLRTRCARLRATGALEAEWVVTPTIYFLTPGEWESVADDLDGTRILQELNHRRVTSLPEAVSRRFGLFAP